MRGAWIEMMLWVSTGMRVASRSPCGERGLKYTFAEWKNHGYMSLPVRGAWIEIFAALPQSISVSRSPCGERGLK